MANGWTFRVVLTGMDANGVMKVSEQNYLHSPNIDFLQFTAFGENKSEMTDVLLIPEIENHIDALGGASGTQFESQVQMSIGDQSSIDPTDRRHQSKIIHFQPLLTQAKNVNKNLSMVIFFWHMILLKVIFRKH